MDQSFHRVRWPPWLKQGSLACVEGKGSKLNEWRKILDCDRNHKTVRSREEPTIQKINNFVEMCSRSSLYSFVPFKTTDSDMHACIICAHACATFPRLFRFRLQYFRADESSIDTIIEKQYIMCWYFDNSHAMVHGHVCHCPCNTCRCQMQRDDSDHRHCTGMPFQ